MHQLSMLCNLNRVFNHGLKFCKHSSYNRIVESAQPQVELGQGFIVIKKGFTVTHLLFTLKILQPVQLQVEEKYVFNPSVPERQCPIQPQVVQTRQNYCFGSTATEFNLWLNVLLKSRSIHMFLFGQKPWVKFNQWLNQMSVYYCL